MTRAQLTGTVADPLLTTRQAAAQLGVSLRTGLLSREGVGVLLQEAEGETYSVAFAHGLTAQDLLSEAEAGRLTSNECFG